MINKETTRILIKTLKTIVGGVWFGNTLVRILSQNAFCPPRSYLKGVLHPDCRRGTSRLVRVWTSSCVTASNK